MWRRLLCCVPFGIAALGNPAVAAEPISVPPRVVPTAASRDILLPLGAIRRFGEMQFHHPGGIFGSALSADGKWLATASQRSVVVWEVATGKPVYRFETGSDRHYFVQKLVFSARSLAYASGSYQTSP